MAAPADHAVPEGTAEPGAPANGAGSAVDPEVIAERVYQLMRAELRLEIVRGSGASHPKE